MQAIPPATRTIVVALFLITFLSITTNAQIQSFTRDGLEYVLELPSPSWRAVSRVDVHEHFDFVNGDEDSGFLRVRKKFVPAAATTEHLFREDEKWELQRLPGYVACSAGQGTDFRGSLKGTVFSYEFVRNGKNMDGRIYYLQLDARTYYALHFTVASDRLQNLREQMDSIARSFRLK